MPTIWRIQHWNGIGPYITNAMDSIADDDSFYCDYGYTTSDPHPAPDEDALLKDKWKELCGENEDRHWFFGFTSLRQAKQWFKTKQACDLLESKGFRLVKYKVNKQYYCKGTHQVMFRKEKAEKLETRKLSTL